MSIKTATQPDSAKVVPMATKKHSVSELLQQYTSDSIKFAGTQDALYERHLVFDRAIDLKQPRSSPVRHLPEPRHSIRGPVAQDGHTACYKSL